MPVFVTIVVITIMLVVLYLKWRLGSFYQFKKNEIREVDPIFFWSAEVDHFPNASLVDGKFQWFC